MDGWRTGAQLNVHRAGRARINKPGVGSAIVRTPADCARDPAACIEDVVILKDLRATDRHGYLGSADDVISNSSRGAGKDSKGDPHVVNRVSIEQATRRVL